METERQATDHEIVAGVIGDIPTKIVKDLHTAAIAALYKNFEELTKKMSDLHPDKIRDIHTALTQYENACEKSIKHKTDVFQKYLSQQVWHVPEDLDIIYNYLKDLDIGKMEEDIEQLDEELQRMSKKIQALKTFNSFHTKTVQYGQLMSLEQDIDVQQFSKIPAPMSQALDASEEISDNLMLLRSDVQQIQASVQDAHAKENVLLGQLSQNEEDEESTSAKQSNPSLVALVDRYGPEQSLASLHVAQTEEHHVDLRDQ